MPSFAKTADAPEKFRVETPAGTVEVSDKEVTVDDAALAAELALTPFVSVVIEKPVKASPKEESK